MLVVKTGFTISYFLIALNEELQAQKEKTMSSEKLSVSSAGRGYQGLGWLGNAWTELQVQNLPSNISRPRGARG